MMTKAGKLKACNRVLSVLALAMLVSGLQLEITSSRGILSVWIHVVVATIFLSGIATHIYLHFGWTKWRSKFGKARHVLTRILFWLFLVTVLSSVVTFVHWLATFTHTPIGGLHGKIALLTLCCALAHAFSRRKFIR